MPLINTSGVSPTGGGGDTPSGGGLTNENEAGTNRVLTNDDLAGNKIIYMTANAASTLTVPAGLTGTEPVSVVQEGTGPTEITADGTTLQSKGNNYTLVQGAGATIIPKGSDVYRLMGDLS